MRENEEKNKKNVSERAKIYITKYRKNNMGSTNEEKRHKSYEQGRT
jgi:hypothetical protein